jgi:signal transduction histidine kinase
MGIFELRGDYIRFSARARHQRVLVLGERLLRSAGIAKLPMDALLKSFHESYLVNDVKPSSPWSAITYWTYSPSDQISRLSFVSGFDPTSNNDYPRELRNSQGIVGTLAARFSKNLSTQLYLSHDYRLDPMLAARPAIDRLGFRSGFALPVVFGSQLAGILKVYFRFPLDKSVSADSDILRELPHRLMLLLRLAEDHYSRLLASRAEGSFQHTVASHGQGPLGASRSQIRAACIRVLEDSCILTGAQWSRIELANENGPFVQWGLGEDGVAAILPNSKCHEDSPKLSIDIHEWNYYARPLVGRLVLGKKPQNMAFSLFDRRFLQEAVTQMALQLSSFLAIEELRAQADRRLNLLRACSELTEYITEATTPDDVLVHMTDLIPRVFSFSSSTIYPAGAVSIPESANSITKIVQAGRKIFGTLVFEGRKECDLTETEAFVLEILLRIGSQALWSLTVMNIVETIAREDARAAMARDIVHAFTADQSALINSLDAILRQVDKLEQEPARGSKTKPMLVELRQRAGLLADIARTQQNILQSYKWFRTDVGKVLQEDVDLFEVLRDIKAAVSTRSSEKNVEVQVSSLPAPVRISWRRTELYLIFWNILHNAVKFSRRGGKVFVTTERRDVGVMIKVRDFGVGIHPSNTSKIWDPGFSTPAPGADSGTSGFGLPAVRIAVERIPGARIEMQSEVNRFTEFEVFIPGDVIRQG